MIALILLFLIIINAAAITAFAIDKRRAMAGQWRLRESTLLGFALLGGSAGALWARRRFRHKTRKQPFAARLDFIAMVQGGIALGLIVAIVG